MAIKRIFLLRNYTFLIFGLIILLILIEFSIRGENYLTSYISAWHLSDFYKNNLIAYLGFTAAVLPLILAELLLPNDEVSKDYNNGVIFWIISIQCNYFFSILSLWIIHSFNITPLFNLSFESLKGHVFLNALFLNALLIVLTLLVFDFFYYWYHRAQHTFSFLWEFHKTHHSIKNLNSIVSYHHIFEELFRVPFIIVPLAVLIHIDAPKLAILSSFYAVYGQFIHMNSKINLGPLRFIFADNYYHRIHHSIEHIHHNKNYAAFFPVWDILFRSVHFPKQNQFPEVGLVGEKQPKTLREYLFYPKPFKKRTSKANYQKE